MTGCRDGVADAESIVRGALSIPRSGLNGTAVAVAVGLVLITELAVVVIVVARVDTASHAADLSADMSAKAASFVMGAS